MNGDDRKNGPRPKRSSTLARHRALRDGLLEAADAAIVSGGLAALRARTLSQAVGCSVGAIYEVFPDLDALVLAINARTLEAMERALRGAGTGRDPAERMRRLARAYLDYAAANGNRWRALFDHRMSDAKPVPAWYAAAQATSFLLVEEPLAALLPGLPAKQRGLLARTVFSAVHGMVDLGLDEKVAEMPVAVLRKQLETVVSAIAAGLAR